jgi:hypothetical protein
MAGVLFEHKVTKKEHKTSTATSSASPASTPWWTARRAN